MQAKVNWKGRLSFTGTADTGFELPLGAKPEVGGDNDGFRPMELMALSLAGCTAMDVISIMTKKRQQVKDFEVKVNAERAEDHPKVLTRAVIEYHAAGDQIAEEALVRSIELSAESYCPAQAMLGELIPLELRYFIYQGENLEDGEPVVEGSYSTGG